MRIELSLVGPAGRRDVAIVADPATPLGRVLPQLAATVGATPDTPAWSSSQTAAPNRSLEQAALTTGSTLSFFPPIHAPSPTAVRTLDLVGGAQSGQVFALEGGRLTIGRAPECDVVLDDDRASRTHALLEMGPTGIVLRDLGSTNGTTVDGIGVPVNGVELRTSQIARVGDSLLAVSDAETAPATVQRTPERVLVNRSPRPEETRRTEPIELPNRRETERPHRIQWITALVPALVGGAVAWAMDAPQFLLFALLSPIMLVSGSLGDRVHWRRSRRRAATHFRQERAAVDTRIASELAAETSWRRTSAPDPPTLRRVALTPGTRLWERRGDDTDRLRVRVGTADLPSLLQIRSGSRMAPAGTVASVPVCLDLGAGPLGVAGPAPMVAGLTRWLISQLAVLHAPRELELVFLLDERTALRWQWARWLPHTRTAALDRDEWTATLARLTKLVAARRERPSNASTPWIDTWFVIVVEPTSRLAELAGLPELLANGPRFGVSAICIDVEAQALPAACSFVIRSQHAYGDRLGIRGAAELADVVIDRVSIAWSEQVSRALAPLVDAGAGGPGALPEACALDDLLALSPEALCDRWRASDGGARTVLGVTADGPLTLDLAADGPHVLVAGTTGSGKSELLRALVIGLAATQPPDDLSFLLVDYKGGAAFAECVNLPHTAGLVTDLDQHLTRRALQSLHAELRRRETLYAAVGVADLTAYRAASADPPIPRLVIVVDEFAALAEELPDFVAGLVGAARRGRSLGVHLVLATQRPGTAVSPEIRANTSVRIALRVTDSAESNDVVGSADAALLDASTPGRAFMRTSRSMVCFQTAQVCGSSGWTAAEPVVEPLGSWRRRMPQGRSATDDRLAQLVSTLRHCAQSTGRSSARSPWLPPLPRTLCQLDLATAGTVVALGRLDCPARQEQPPLVLDLADASAVLVVGRGGAGRSTALASVALGAAAAADPDLEIYLVDGAGDLARSLRGLPQLATVIEPSDTALAPRLLQRLAAGAGALSRTRDSRPNRLLLLDAWDVVLSNLDDFEAARCADQLSVLIRSAGVTVVVAGDRSLLLPRFAGAFDERLLLALSDRNDYALAGIAAHDLPAEFPPGRGVRASDGLTFQIAHAGPTTEAHAICSRVHELAAAGNRPAASSAIRLRALPERVSLDAVAAIAAPLVLGVAGDAAEPCTLDLVAHRARLLIAGAPRSGKSTLLRTLLRDADRLSTAVTPGVELRVAATTRSPLAFAAQAAGISVVRPGDGASTVGAIPSKPTLLLIDDSDAFVDGPAGEQLLRWLEDPDAPLAVAVAGRCEDLAATYRGVAAQVRRNRCGILLRPGPIDGELLGIRVARRSSECPPGRGLLVGDPAWGALFSSGEPVPIQVAQP